MNPNGKVYGFGIVEGRTLRTSVRSSPAQVPLTLPGNKIDCPDCIAGVGLISWKIERRGK